MALTPAEKQKAYRERRELRWAELNRKAVMLEMENEMLRGKLVEMEHAGKTERHDDEAT